MKTHLIKSIMQRLLAALALVFASQVAQAVPVVVDASGAGWCNDVFGCNNTDTSLINNTFAGNNDLRPGNPSTSIFRDWFAFNVPNIAGNILSATISIWNDGQNFNTVNPAAVFNLYEAASIDFAGLTNGPSLGSVLTSAADNGSSEYDTLNLNASGLAALNAAQGSLFVFGGNNDDGEQIFGYTSGVPIAFLTLNTDATASVPEPATLSLLGLGLGLTGVARLRRRRPA